MVKNKLIKKCLNRRAFNLLELMLVYTIWLITVSRIVETAKNLYYLKLITPKIQELEILPLMFFFQVYHINILILVVCLGFLLLYYQRRNKQNA